VAALVLTSAGCGRRFAATKPAAPRITPAELAKLPDDKLEETVVEALCVALDDDYGHELEIMATQPPGAQAIYTTGYLEAEVSNGGFNQYFWNTEGIFAEMALRGYELMGAKQHAAIVRKAIAIYSQEKKRQQQFKAQGTLEAFSASYKDSKFDPLDTAFYALDEKEDSEVLRARFIRSHPEQCLPR
jgi:hypothetical protein